MDSKDDIQSVEETNNTLDDGVTYTVTTTTGRVLFVPDTMENRHRVIVQEWLDDGGALT